MAHGEICPTKDSSANATIVFEKAVPMYDNDASQDWIQRKSGKFHEGERSVGLTVGRLFWRTSMMFSVRLNKQSGRACVYLTDVGLAYGFGKTPVYIDRRYRPGSCQYKEVYRHENAHVAILNTVGYHFQPWLKKKLAASADEMQPVLSRDPKRAQAGLNAKISSFSQSLMRMMEKELEKYHSIIDSSHNYRRIQDICKKW